MRSKLTLSFIALSGLAVLPTAGFASAAKQNDTARQEDRDRGDKVREMTGCLQKEGDEYKLMADNGSTWELKSDRANLRDYVGKTVRITGTVDHKKMHDAKERAKEKTEDNPNEHGHLTVTDVRPVSRSCNK
jgi:membrane protein implicated in regulation of membrane protease activity